MENTELPINHHDYFICKESEKKNYTALNPMLDTEVKSPTPQLDVILTDLQCLATEYANFIEELQSKLNSIYSFPHPAKQIGKAGIENVKQENDIIPNIKEQIVSLSISKERLGACLLHLSNII